MIPNRQAAARAVKIFSAILVSDFGGCYAVSRLYILLYDHKYSCFRPSLVLADSSAGTRGLLSSGALSLGIGKVDDGLGEVLIQGDVPVGIVLTDDLFEAETLQFVEAGQAQFGGLSIAGVAESREDVGEHGRG